MPPSGGGKRKRGDRSYSEDDPNRPLPHRPGNLNLARHNQSPTPRDGSAGRARGDRRGGRGGRNTMNPASPVQQRNTIPKASSPVQVVSTASQPANIPTPEPVPDSDPLPSKAHQYVFLTAQIQEEWATTGKDALREQLVHAAGQDDDINLMNIVQEIIQAVSGDLIPAEEAGATFRSGLGIDTEGELPSAAQHVLLDVVSVFFEDNQGLGANRVAEFLASTGLSEEIMRLQLDQPLLVKLGLISGRFKQMSIRKTTNILYRQANFNLMREESEGFAKLITELFTTSGNEPPTRAVTHKTVEKIKAMIGAFDLDVGRSLDVVLDVFGSVLVRHFRFLVRLLRASPWWPVIDQQDQETLFMGGLPRWAEPEASEALLSDSEKEEIQLQLQARDIAFWREAHESGLLAFQQIGRVRASQQAVERASLASDDFRSQWIAQTKTLPPKGNRDAAQLLGFKLRFYSSSIARELSLTLPDNLVHLAALLIKIGFISLNDLYPHIWRSDEEMEDLKQQKTKEKAEREQAARPGAGTKNALAMAGALADDTVPVAPPRVRDLATRSNTPSRDPDVAKATTKEQSAEPNDQKVALLKSLLAVGALPEALFILGRFPWIIDLYPEVPEYLLRILHHCLGTVYERTRPLQTRSTLQMARPTTDTEVSSLLKGQMRLVDGLQKKTLKWANLDRDDSSDGTDYRFYWDDWSDNIPVCQTVDDVFTLCDTLMTLVGVKIGQDPTLVLKLTRIGKQSLADDSSDQNKVRWLNLIKRVLLPALSLTRSNAGVINEVFELMSQYPTTTRYIMYLEWSSGRTSRIPDMKTAFEQARAETKDILKRISKTNVKPMARALAKVAYANPHIVITTALTQIEVYDSIADVFVEGARYFTDLGYDVLTWAMISSMSKSGRTRTQDGGIFASRWLSALAQFAGKIYKRYSMMKAGPILQYVADQLDHGNSTDLKMLEQVTSSMAGIATDTSFNDAQLLAMGGGSLLQSQTILQLLDRRNDSKTTSRRLMKALQDHGLTAKFLISMAQQRESCVFEESDVPLKAIGNTFDEISRVMAQYLDLLRSNLPPNEFQDTIPDIAQLLVDYEIPADIAFWIARPILSKKMQESDRDTTDGQQVNGDNSTNGDVNMIDDDNSGEEDGEASEDDEIPKTAATPSEGDLDGINTDEPNEQSQPSEQWHPVLKPLMATLKDHLPPDITSLIGVGFYVTFWQLSLYDIYVPSKAYEDEMGRQKKKIAAISADRSNISASGARTREAQIKQHQNVIDELLKENRQHLKSYSESRARLNREKDQWFVDKLRQSEEINTALMEYCFLPRILCSPQDAFFCFKFLKFLHVNSTPNFRTLGVIDILLRPNRLMSLIFMCTSKESDNLGRFLRELLQDFARWHKDKNIYEREAFGSKKNLIGFAVKVENNKPQNFLEFEIFRRILFKWHSNIHAALIRCLTSDEYMHVRNAISVLRAISPVFPAVKYHGTEQQKAVDKLRTSDREDLKVASAALLGALSRREKEWVMPAAFRQGQDKAVPAPETSTDPQKIKIPEEEQTKTSAPESDSKTKELPKNPKHQPSLSDDNRSRNSSKPRADISTRDTLRQPAVPPGEQSRIERRSTRVAETDRTRRSPPPPSRHTLPSSLPSRPDNELRNGYRDGPRSLTRVPGPDVMRPDSRSGYARHAPPERSLEVGPDSSRYSKGHSERDDRLSRREYESRHGHGHDDRRPLERDIRSERDKDHHSRPMERDQRSEREPGRLKPDKRPDLIDETHTSQTTSSRPTSVQPATGGINPERAALINNNADSRTGMTIRGSAQDKPRAPRQQSPRRDDERRHQERPDRDERPQRRTDPLSRPLPPSQQSSARPPSYTNRDSRHPPVDMQHGRLEPESPQRSANNDSEVPSGPRQRPLPTPRGRGGPPSSTVVQPPERPTPTGPARHFRNGSTQEHPSASKATEATGVHPDRRNQIAADGPRNSQRPTQGPPPPSGPRNTPSAPPTPTGPSPIPRGTPTGPQIDNAGRGRRNPIDTLNNTLAQSQGTLNASGRGRGGPRQNLPPQPPPPSGPAGRANFGPPETGNPNDMPVQPRPPSRRETTKEDDMRPNRSRPDDRRFDDSRRNDRVDGLPREPRDSRANMSDDLPPRKHHRDESGHYGGYPRGGMRNASESKRPRRGGGN